MYPHRAPCWSRAFSLQAASTWVNSLCPCVACLHVGRKNLARYSRERCLPASFVPRAEPNKRVTFTPDVHDPRHDTTAFTAPVVGS